MPLYRETKASLEDWGSIVDADHIVVLDKGPVVEEGRHGSLLAKGGVYARLYRTTEDR